MAIDQLSNGFPDSAATLARASGYGPRMDRIATGCSAACAVHCAITPVVLPLVPMAFGRVLGPGLEWGFVSVSLLLGTVSLGHSYRAVHRDNRPLIGFVIGMVILLSSKGFPERWVAAELAAVAAGASCIIAAHVQNLRLRRLVRDDECACPCHSEARQL